MRIEDFLLIHKDDTREALNCDGISMSYSELHKEALRVSDLVMQKAESNNVLLLHENSLEYCISFFAVLFSGKTVVPIRPNSKEREIRDIVDFCDIDFILTDSKHADLMLEICNVPTSSISVYLVDESCFLLSSDRNQDGSSCEASEVALLIQTSGTSGKPKLVMLSHENIISNVFAIEDNFKFEMEDKTYIILPLCLSSANIHFLLHVYLGANIYLSKRPFFGPEFLKTLQQEKITNCICVPWIFQYFVEKSNGRSFPNLKCVGSSAGIMRPELYKMAVNRYPKITFYNCYGQTEASPRISHNKIDTNNDKYSSVGQPLKGISIKVIGDNGEEVDHFVTGEIIVNSPSIMVGYYKDEVKTAECINNGWLYTGDVGYMDDEEYLYITGRKKNIIIYNGNNIYPEEVEGIISRYPGVKDVVVYGVPHPLFQEVPVAKIVLDNPKVSVEQIKTFCDNQLQRYKCPKHFYLCERIDKTVSGKIIRRDLT